MKELFKNWLIKNNKPNRYANTITTISNDLQKVNYKDYDLYSITDPTIAKKIKNNYFKFNQYFDKNKRGNYMYSSAFDRYIEFLLDYRNSTHLNNNIFPDEIEESNNLYEGTKKQIIVNSYERNPKARQICIDHYGYECQICGFNFKKTYGEIGKNFIHVHHIVDLATIGKNYKIDPIKDMIPVCPNCHAMLHRKKPAYTPQELKQLIKIKNNYH
ncbi:HNH endonuclease [Nautilia sp. PV-1]|uniref:HNH endonuclease n=1 Tax=Nautilia sp. PV-1 TaxID=2579250 RepID=UPI001AEF6FF3|nr:HNH endonuclease [Nautilia sp. PV-1]